MKFTSHDGLMQSTDPEAVARWDASVVRRENAKASWADRLREMGVKFAHPDDGWVKRQVDGCGYVTVSWYPLFDDRPEVGDLIAFGCPPDGVYGVDHYTPRVEPKKGWKGRFDVPKGEVESARQGYRIARVTEVESDGGGPIPWRRYHYEDTGLRVPPIPTRRQRLVGRLRRWMSDG